jgi:hypothetical protein
MQVRIFDFSFNKGASHNSLEIRSWVRIDMDLFDNMGFRMIMGGFEV